MQKTVNTCIVSQTAAVQLERSAAPPPPQLWRQNTANIQNESSINCKEIEQEQSKINSNHQLSCLKLEKFYGITNTSLKVSQNVSSTLETFSTKTTGKVSEF